MSSALEKFCGSPFWDTNLTWNTNDPDFTPCFEKTALVWIPCLFLWVATILEFVFLHEHRRRQSDKNLLNQSKLLLTALIIVTQILDYLYIIYHYYNEGQTYPSVAFYTPIVYFVTFLLCLTLLLFQHKQQRYSSGTLFIFWLLLVIRNIVELRTMVKNPSEQMSSLPFIVFIIYFTACVLQFILSAFADVSSSVRISHVDEKRSPEELASFVSRITYSWFDRFAWTGFRRPIIPDDLWTLQDDFKTANVNSEFEHAWEKEVFKAQRSKLQTPQTSPGSSFSYERLPNVTIGPEYKMSITKALFRTFGRTFFGGTLLAILGDLTGLGTILILQELINFIGNKEEPFWHGILYVIMISATSFIESLFLNRHWDIIAKMCYRVQSAFISAIYKKSLNISNATKNSATLGEIVNLMSVDVERLSQRLIDSPVMFTSPIQITIGIYLMYRVIGISALIGLTVFIAFAPINAILARKIEKLELLTMEYKDERVKLMNEMLAGIKVLKLYAWEPSFSDKIKAVRNKEVGIMKKLVWLTTFLSFLFNYAPYLVCLIMFASFVLIDEHNVLDAKTAFISLSILHFIQEPLSYYPILMADIIQMRVSLQRLNNFMNMEELDSDQIEHEIEDDVITIENGTFSWQPEGDPILSEISLNIQKGSLVAIVGPVGSGKSSLILSLLGEMEKLNGRVNIYGSIAYVPQIAWIQNATLRDNILFGNEMIEETYNKILSACELRPDLTLLAGGDLTEIGEKGINLSGGQKQRVSLGRAVYEDADIYLLDDPLSAVDAHVGKSIFETVIGSKGLLKKKTRVLVTHGLKYLPEVDYIVVMNKGKISDCGTYTKLIDKKEDFFELIKKSQHDDFQGVESPTSRTGRPQYVREISTISAKSASSVDSTPWDGIPVRRRFSRSLSHHDVLPKESHNANAKLITEETLETGKVNWNVYYYYMKCTGLVISIITTLCFCSAWGLITGSDVWLRYWSSDPPGDSHLVNLRLGVYGAFMGVQAIFTVAAYLLAGFAMLKAAQLLHENMLIRVLRSPMTFFDTTPLGRIINRFSHDVDTVDTTFPPTVIFAMELWFRLMSCFIIVSLSSPIIIAIFIPVGILYYITQKFYISTSRQLMRLDSNFRSPIYSHFSETLSGLAVIRAFKRQQSFIQESNNKVDCNHKAVFPANSASRWMAIRLDLLGNVIIFFTALFSTLKKDSIDPSMLGLTVSYAVTLTYVFNMLVKLMSEIETYIVSVERIKEYTEIESEAPWTFDSESVDGNWPEQGTIIFDNYSTRYREGLDLVLKGIKCEIKSGEKIGVVGRTGAGKSSLTLALFRLIEASDGKILIDDINISDLGLHSVRSKLTIIPQEPVLFCGTLRMNLDPFDQYKDDQIWYALEHSHLKDFVSGLNECLNYEIVEGGENLSVGQRQLLCLARALLRKSKVLVLDEATAAVDLKTDDLIQTTIRKEFSDCTILTIAHRLNTIMDNNRIIVLQDGSIKEFDSPENLLKKSNSIFYSMAKDAGLVNFKF